MKSVGLLHRLKSFLQANKIQATLFDSCHTGRIASAAISLFALWNRLHVDTIDD